MHCSFRVIAHEDKHAIQRCSQEESTSRHSCTGNYPTESCCWSNESNIMTSFSFIVCLACTFPRCDGINTSHDQHRAAASIVDRGRSIDRQAIFLTCNMIRETKVATKDELVSHLEVEQSTERMRSAGSTTVLELDPLLRGSDDGTSYGSPASPFGDDSCAKTCQKDRGAIDMVREWMFPSDEPRSMQLMRPENLAIPACYLCVGLMQGLCHE